MAPLVNHLRWEILGISPRETLGNSTSTDVCVCVHIEGESMGLENQHKTRIAGTRAWCLV